MSIFINLLINNQDIETNDYSKVKDPGYLTNTVGYVAQGNPEHVNQAVNAAHQAFLIWRDMSLEERSRLLLETADVLQSKIEEYSSILTQEAGMLLSASIGEMHASVHVIRETVELAQEFLQSEQLSDDATWISIEKVPMGVIGALIPWNVPMAIAISKIAPILMTGNTVVIKPSPNAAIGVSLALKEMAAILPPGVINVIHGDIEVGKALTKHSLVRKITLTGGDQAAKSVMESAASTLKRVHFELGGNDPAIVLEDINLQEIMPKIADLVFRRSGQVCVATKRIYIPQSIYKEACTIFLEYVNQYKIGHGLNERVTFGPVNNEQQFTYVKELIDRTKNYSEVFQLGEKLEPDNWNNGYYIQPTVAINVRADEEIVTCEQFGPVIPLIAYSNENEVIQLANNTEFGLGSSIWTKDFERGLQLARKLEVGMTGINGSIDSALGMRHVPFGGIKQSGIGWERGIAGLREFVDYHSITYHKI